jgi:hypothetical protein
MVYVQMRMYKKRQKKKREREYRSNVVLVERRTADSLSCGCETQEEEDWSERGMCADNNAINSSISMLA